MSFSIKQLLGLILVFSLGLGALIGSNNPLIASLAKPIVVGVFALFAYGIWTSKAETRAFRIGFLCWGGLYFLLYAVGDGKTIDLGLRYLPDRLITTFAPNILIRDAQGTITQVNGEWLDRFRLIGRCVLSIVLGIVGGWVTVHFYHKRQRMLAEEAIDKAG
jgi:hypothetical protein